MEEYRDMLIEEAEALRAHLETLDKDSKEYKDGIANLATVSHSIVEVDKAAAEKALENKKRVQAIKQWQAEHDLKIQELDENHAQFMIKTIVDAALRGGEDLIFVDTYERESAFEGSGSIHYLKFFQGLMNRLPGLRKK